MQPNNISQDQATGLRGLQNNVNSQVKVITVTGGKGGVGKTSVSINMAHALAHMGQKVMILDADLGLANVDVMLGLKTNHNLSHVLAGEAKLDDIIVYGPNGIGIIPATSGLQNMVELTQGEYAGLINAFNSMQTQFDILIVDTAAGISEMVMSFSKAAQDVVIVVCDEPTSITDAYALIKLLSREHGVHRFKIVANMVKHLRQGEELFSKLNKVTDRFLNVVLELVATIPFDEIVRTSIRKQKLIAENNPESPAAVAYYSLANSVMSWPISIQPNGNLEFFVEKLAENNTLK